MPLRRLTIITICALWCVTWGMVPSVHGQIIHGQRPQLSQGLTYISWKVKGKEEFTLAQLFLPVSAHAPLKDNVEVAVFGGASRSEADWAVQGDDISGLVDSRVQIAASLNNDQILLSAGASLPTGQTRLTPVQQLLMTFMSADFLNFPVKTPGEGFNLFGEVGAAFPLGPWAAGVAGAVFVAGEYKPYETDLTYRPGSRIVLTTGLERVWTGSEHLSADVVVVVSGEDKANDVAIFRDGMQIDMRLTAGFTIATAGVEAGLRYILRGKDERPSDEHGQLISELHNNNGNDLRLSLSSRVPVSAGVAIWASYQGKMIAANEYAPGTLLFEDAARLHGFGGGADIQISERTLVSLGARVWTGSSDGIAKTGAFDLTGYEVIQRLTITLP